MLPRKSFHPPDHLSIGIPLTHSHALVCGETIFIGGQADISGQVLVTCPNYKEKQTHIAIDNLLSVLKGVGCEAGDLVKLTAFYVLGDSPDEDSILRIIAKHLGGLSHPGPAITLVPIVTN